jgi:hypothetical protein
VPTDLEPARTDDGAITRSMGHQQSHRLSEGLVYGDVVGVAVGDLPLTVLATEDVTDVLPPMVIGCD